MDVVKTNIAKLGGAIDLQSEDGIGTKVTVTLPITLAIISALVVKLGERLFAIPLANVQEAVVLDPAGVRNIEGQGGGHAPRLEPPALPAGPPLRPRRRPGGRDRTAAAAHGDRGAARAHARVRGGHRWSARAASGSW